MNFLYLLFLLMVVRGGRLIANLKILSFDPPTFNLTFSEPVMQPKFQLLLNGVVTWYKITSNKTQYQEYFLFTAYPKKHIDELLIEVYSLVFNHPLDIKNKQNKLLATQSYMLVGEKHYGQSRYMLLAMEEKDSFYKYQNEQEEVTLNNLAIFMVVIVYLCSFLSVVGLWMIDLVQIYVLIQLHSQFYTILDYKMGYYLLFEMHQASKLGEVYEIVYMALPALLVLLTFSISQLARKILEQWSKRGWRQEVVYEFLAYKLWLISWRVLCFPLLANTLHMLADEDHFERVCKTYQAVIIYYGSLLSALYVYFLWMKLNPQPHQTNFPTYLQTTHFHQYRTLHKDLTRQWWYTRNYSLLLNIKHFLLIIIISYVNSPFPNLIVQTIHLLYLFTQKPYANNPIISNAAFVAQLCTVVFYYYCSLTTLYFRISEQINTSYVVETTMLVQLIMFCFGVFGLGLFGCYELYTVVQGLKQRSRQRKYEKRYKNKVEHLIQRQRQRNQSMKERDYQDMQPDSYKRTLYREQSVQDTSIKKLNLNNKQGQNKRSLLLSLAQNDGI